ncbi:MAG: hypothetical protein IKB32_00805 [Clostridia bacterium]|nr:hypothetical protein [Clostridia bacterium]
MTKKILSIILCVAMILPARIIPMSTAGGVSTYEFKEGIKYFIDFETALPH